MDNRQNFALEKLQNELKRYISEYKRQIVLLESVTKATKKDGTEFANFSKNFNSIYKTSYESASIISNKLIIAGTVEGQYTKIEINTYELVKNSNRNFEESRIIKLPCLEAYVNLTVDEMLENIEKLKDNLVKNMENYTKELNESEKAFNELAEAFASFKILAKQYEAGTRFAFSETMNLY